MNLNYKSKITNTAYDTSALLGKIVGIFGAIFGIFIGIILLIFGFILIFKKQDPNNTTPNSFSSKKIGFILLSIGLVIIILSSFSLYLTLTFKAYQAAQGVAAVVGVVNNAFD